MKTEIVIALISSFVALIVALFSYFSSKTSTKVEAMKGYLDFLRQKMSRLEEKLDSLNVQLTNLDSSFDVNGGNYIRLLDECHKKVFQSSQYLFKYHKSEFIGLQDRQKEVEISQAYYEARKYNYELRDEYKKDVLELKDLIHHISEIDVELKKLIVAELEETYNVFENLSLMINIEGDK